MATKSDKAMQTTNSFSFQRLMLLFKQKLIINKRRYPLGILAFSGGLFFSFVFSQSAKNFSNWSNHDYLNTFIPVFISLGIAYSAFSFPGFRTKEKSMVFLMLPATGSEKFVFEILTRIVAFIFLMPLLFWIVANMEGAILHSFFPELVNYKFSIRDSFFTIVKDGKFEFWALILSLQGLLFMFIAPFAGASYFSKSPLFKTLLTFSIVIMGYFLFAYILNKSLNLDGLHPVGKNLIFTKDSQTVLKLMGIGMVLVNLSLLAIAWFSLKEKEA
jgi:hypothetical protein